MKELYEKITRPCRKIPDFLLLAGIATFMIVLFGQLLGQTLVNRAGIGQLFLNLTGDESVAVFLGNYFLFIGIWILSLLVMAIFKANRPMLKEISFTHEGNGFKGLGIGLALGFGINALCVLLSWLMGDIKLSFFAIDPLLILLFFVSVFIQSSAEEITTRLYLYQKLRRRYRNPLVAIIGNGLLFVFLHIANPGFTIVSASQIMLIALIFSLFVYYYDSLWIPFAFHAGWNFTQSIIFGLPNSGIVSAYSIFNLEAASARNGLFYNVNFGVEGSIGSSLVLLAVLIALIYLNKGKTEKCDLWANAEKEAIIKREKKAAEKAAKAQQINE